MSLQPDESSSALLAALYLEAVLPVLPLVASRDAALAAALAGPDFAAFFSTAGSLRCRIAVREGVPCVTFGAAAVPGAGDVRLWFPTCAQVVRAFDGRRRFAFALPLGGWSRLTSMARLSAAGLRLENLLNVRPSASDPSLAVHAWGNLAVGLAASASWLRHAAGGPGLRSRMAGGVLVFSCPAFPAPLWIDLDSLASGAGAPPPGTGLMASVHFADLDTVLAELDRRLDAPAALGLGTLRVEGHIPLAESLGLLMLEVGKLLQPSRA